MTGPRRVALVGLAVLAVAAVAVPLAVRKLLWRWEQNPVLRGRLLAQEQGCERCHAPGRGPGIPNPGSRWGTVPRFQAGNAAMYVEGIEEVEQFIRFGAPLAWLEKDAVRERLASQRIAMPAYGELLDDREIADLVAWSRVMERLELPRGEEVEAGRELAGRHGCLACHGAEGSGGLPNPGSLGGFIPGFLGRNFDDLVADRSEFDEWVLEGTSRRLGRNPLVRWFWRRQRLAMPAYEDSLTRQDLDHLWAWIQASRRELAADDLG